MLVKRLPATSVFISAIACYCFKYHQCQNLSMKVCLISSENSGINVVPAIADALRSRVHGIEVVLKVAATPLDIVNEVSLAGGCRAVAVILHYEKENAQVRVLMEKLVDLDLQGKHTMKFLEQDVDLDGAQEAARIADAIMVKLFGKTGPQQAGGNKASYKEL